MRVIGNERIGKPNAFKALYEGRDKYYSSPEGKAEHRMKMKANWTPEVRAKLSATRRRLFAEDESFRARNVQGQIDSLPQRLTSAKQLGAQRRGVPFEPFQYRVVSPQGDVFIVDSLKQFCNGHNLDNANMYAVANGKRKQHKGWTVTKELLPSE